MRAREEQAGQAPPSAPQVARPPDRRAGPTGEAPPCHQATTSADGAARGRARILAGALAEVPPPPGFPLGRKEEVHADRKGNGAPQEGGAISSGGWARYLVRLSGWEIPSHSHHPACGCACPS